MFDDAAKENEAGRHLAEEDKKSMLPLIIVILKLQFKMKVLTSLKPLILVIQKNALPLLLNQMTFLQKVKHLLPIIWLIPLLLKFIVLNLPSNVSCLERGVLMWSRNTSIITRQFVNLARLI